VKTLSAVPSLSSITSTYDLSVFSEDNIDALKANNVFSSGDKILVKGIAATVVSNRNSHCIQGKENIYIQPTATGEQFVCLQSTDRKQTERILFDEAQDYIAVRGKRYNFGDSVPILGETCTLVKGSLILVFDDGFPQSFPFGTAEASQVLQCGNLIVRDTVCRSIYQVADKVSGDTTTGEINFYVYEKDSNVTMQATSMAFSMNDAKTESSITLIGLYTNDNGTKTMEDIMQIAPESVVIQCQDSNESMTTTIDSSGISFNADSGSIFFGQNKEFKIAYTPPTGIETAILSIEAKNSTTGEYDLIWYIQNQVASSV
jgi:hypothetical protein